MPNSLLPYNSSVFEHSIGKVAKKSTALPVEIDTLFNPDTCPAHLLGHLAWSLSVDAWDSNLSERVKRGLCRFSIEVHKSKGTVHAIKRALAQAELGNSLVLEGRSGYLRGGSMPRDGFVLRGNNQGWAQYKVVVDRLLSLKQAQFARLLLTIAQPVRCHLWALDFSGATALHNGVIFRDGQYTRGVA